MTDKEKQLDDIQGREIHGLLAGCEQLPGNLKTDFEAARFIGGPRLVAAMKAVGAKGDWMAYANANHGDMGSLPDDQIKAIMTCVGAPKDARYYKNLTGKRHGINAIHGSFDGAVDPASKTVTLFFRAAIVRATAEQGVAGELVSPETVEAFKPKFKIEIENAWSGGKIKPAQPIVGVDTFDIVTKVAIVPPDLAHLTFYVVPERFPRSAVGDDLGQLREKANDKRDLHCDQTLDPRTGQPAGPLPTSQVGSAHEFGHAVGLDHPRPRQQQTDEERDRCDYEYGKTAEERASIMGAGHDRKVITRGVQHNDFEPFLTIGEKWGEEILPGNLKSRNKWTVVGK